MVKLWSEFFQLLRDHVPDASQFFVSEHVCFFALKNHAASGERGSFGYEYYRVFAGIRETILAKQFGQTFDVEFVFRNDATVGSPGQGGEHCRESGITSEYFQNQYSFVRSGRRAEIMCEGNRAGNTGAETNTVICSGNIVVHGFGNSHDFHSFLAQAYRVAQRVVAPDRDQVIDAHELQVLQYFRGQVVDFVRVFVL